MAHLLGSFIKPRAVTYALKFKPFQPEFFIRERGPRRPNGSEGKGGQHHKVGTMSLVVEKEGLVSSSRNKQRNNGSTSNGNAIDNTVRSGDA